MVDYLCRSRPTPDPALLGGHFPPKTIPGSSDYSRAACRAYVDIPDYGHHQKCGWKTSTRSYLAVYAQEGHSGQHLGGLDGLYTVEQPHTPGGMEKFPQWSQQLFFQRARIPVDVSFRSQDCYQATDANAYSM
jgi:hypothetical protein